MGISAVTLALEKDEWGINAETLALEKGGSLAFDRTSCKCLRM